MKLAVQLVCAAIIGAILMYVFIPEPENTGVSQQDYDAMKGVYENVVAENLAITSFTDSLQWEKQKVDSAIKLILVENSRYKDKLKDSSARIKALAAQVLALSSGAEKDLLCDSLAKQVTTLIEAYERISDRYDYLNRYIDSTSIFHNLIVKELKEANRKLLDQYNALYSAYMSLVTDQAALQKILRRQKLKTKIAAVLGIIGTGAALFK